MKKKIFTLLTLLATVCSGAWAAEVANLDPVGVFTWTNTPAITYDGGATSWAINQGGISGGKIGRYTGPYAIVKFDASSFLAGKVLLTATLKFEIVAGAYNSSMNIAQLADASFDPATVTTETFDPSASQFQAGEWSAKNSTTPFAYDVTKRVEENNVLAFAIYTNTGREQTLQNVQLALEYSTGEVAKFNYSLTAVDEKAIEIETLASGEEYEGKTVNAYFPYMFYKDDVLYTTAQTPYSVSFDKDNKTANVTYTEASSDIVAYVEGEDFDGQNVKDNENYSNGKTGHANGNKTAEIATLPAGKYKATIMFQANGNRSIIIRNMANSDVETNTIVALPIDKNSKAGVFESEEFTLTESTTVGFSGYTSGTKTNQSADIDYLFITKTGESSESITVTDAGYATYVTNCDLDFSASTIKAYSVNVTGKGVATMTQVDNVPAGTPVLLYAEGGATENIPTMTGAAAVADNDLVAGTGAAVATTDGGYTNMILNNGSKGAGFYYANDQFVDANRAYLHFDSSLAPEAGARMILSFGETTGIESVKSADNKVQSGVYNIAGQRVAQPSKGLYIVNGKKVIVK